MIGIRFSGRHYGQRLNYAALTGRTHGRTDQYRRTSNKPLPKGGRPHMAKNGCLACRERLLLMDVERTVRYTETVA